MNTSRICLIPLLSTLLLVSCNREPGPPDIIFISIEDTKPALGCYGDTIAISPEIDEFARDAVLFEDVHSNVPLCTPSRTSLLTGIRPSTSGIVKIDDDWQAMLPGAVSLPRHLKDHGYHTILAGKIHDYRCGGMDSAYSRVFDIHGLHSNDLAFRALNYAKQQDQPVFLAIGYSKVHLPWNATAGAKKRYDPDAMPVKNRSSDFKGNPLSEEDIKLMIRDYYACITDVDSLVGELLDTLRGTGHFENSVIFLGAMDHGYSLGYHGKWGKGGLYDDETMVPLLIRVPGNPSNGKRTGRITELVDLYPTVVDLCGLPAPPQSLEGTSLKGLLQDPDRPWKKAAFTHRAYHIKDRAVKTETYTLILREGEKAELYDREKDPDNLVNIASAHPEKVSELLELLEAGWESAKPAQ